MFKRREVYELLLKGYKANPDLRDYNGLRAEDHWPEKKRPSAAVSSGERESEFIPLSIADCLEAVKPESQQLFRLLGFNVVTDSHRMRQSMRKKAGSGGPPSMAAPTFHQSSRSGTVGSGDAKPRRSVSHRESFLRSFRRPKVNKRQASSLAGAVVIAEVEEEEAADVPEAARASTPSVTGPNQKSEGPVLPSIPNIPEITVTECCGDVGLVVPGEESEVTSSDRASGIGRILENCSVGQVENGSRDLDEYPVIAKTVLSAEGTTPSSSDAVEPFESPIAVVEDVGFESVGVAVLDASESSKASDKASERTDVVLSIAQRVAENIEHFRQESEESVQSGLDEAEVCPNVSHELSELGQVPSATEEIQTHSVVEVVKNTDGVPMETALEDNKIVVTPKLKNSIVKEMSIIQTDGAELLPEVVGSALKELDNCLEELAKEEEYVLENINDDAKDVEDSLTDEGSVQEANGTSSEDAVNFEFGEQELGVDNKVVLTLDFERNEVYSEEKINGSTNSEGIDAYPEETINGGRCSERNKVCSEEKNNGSVNSEGSEVYSEETVIGSTSTNPERNDMCSEEKMNGSTDSERNEVYSEETMNYSIDLVSAIDNGSLPPETAFKNKEGDILRSEITGKIVENLCKDIFCSLERVDNGILDSEAVLWQEALPNGKELNQDSIEDESAEILATNLPEIRSNVTEENLKTTEENSDSNYDAIDPEQNKPEVADQSSFTSDSVESQSPNFLDGSGQTDNFLENKNNIRDADITVGIVATSISELRLDAAETSAGNLDQETVKSKPDSEFGSETDSMKKSDPIDDLESLKNYDIGLISGSITKGYSDEVSTVKAELLAESTDKGELDTVLMIKEPEIVPAIKDKQEIVPTIKEEPGIVSAIEAEFQTLAVCEVESETVLTTKEGLKSESTIEEEPENTPDKGEDVEIVSIADEKPDAVSAYELELETVPSTKEDPEIVPASKEETENALAIIKKAATDERKLETHLVSESNSSSDPKLECSLVSEPEVVFTIEEGSEVPSVIESKGVVGKIAVYDSGKEEISLLGHSEESDEESLTSESRPVKNVSQTTDDDSLVEMRRTDKADEKNVGTKPAKKRSSIFASINLGHHHHSKAQGSGSASTKKTGLFGGKSKKSSNKKGDSPSVSASNSLQADSPKSSKSSTQNSQISERVSNSQENVVETFTPDCGNLEKGAKVSKKDSKAPGKVSKKSEKQKRK